MIRRATDRLLIGLILALAGAGIALFAGLPEAAVLVAPWATLVTLGLTNARLNQLVVTVGLEQDRVLLGDEVEVVTNVSGAAGSVEVTCIPSGRFFTNSASEHQLTTSPVGELLVGDRATVRSKLPATVWGTHDMGSAEIEVTEPYGLFRWSGLANNTARIRVHPTTTELRNLLTPWLVRRVSGAHLSAAAGRGVEYADIRKFGPGDSLRDINWRASARSQDLWVSERHPDRATDVVLFLDSFVESGHDVQRMVGLAIEAAVALAESHLSVTDRVGLIELGGIVRWVAPGTGKIQLQRLTDALLSTGLYANVTDRDLGMVPPRALPPRSFIVALTPLLDDRFIRSLFHLAARGHDVAVVECAAAWHAQPAVEGNKDLSESVALRIWQAEREVVRDQLAENGISVGTWRDGDQIDVVLSELTRRRSRTVRVGRR